MKAKKIVMAGGGTGGHIFPAVAIANAIKKIEPEQKGEINKQHKGTANKSVFFDDDRVNKIRVRVWVNEFITQMEYAYAAADVVISRAGAMAIAELCVMQKPAILVPYPFAAEDHQTVNARKLEEKNAGIMITDSEAAGKLVPVAINLAKDPGRQQKLSENISKLAVKNADEVIAKAILETIKD